MKQNPCLPFLGLLIVFGSATSCQEKLPNKQAAERTVESSAQTDADSSRQKAVRLLASRLRWYHDSDSLAAANPGSTDGDILDIGKRRFVFKTRADLRADLNRVLDSLRRTGPLVMGNVGEATDTVSYKGPRVRSIPNK
jgi:hypothetical protein